MWVRVPSASPKIMKLSDLVRTYLAVQSHYSRQFKDAEVYCEHDTLYIHLDEPITFSDKDLEFLDELGLHIDDTEDSDSQVVSFYMFI